MVPHSGFAEAESIGNSLILQALSDHLDDLPLASGEGFDLDLFGVNGLAGVGTSHFAQHTRDQKTIQPDLACIDLHNGFEQSPRRFSLVDQTNGAETNGAAMHFDIAYSRQHHNMGSWGCGMQLREQVKPVGVSEIDFQQDDIWLLTDSDSKRLLRTGGLSHDRHTRFTFEEHAQSCAYDGVAIDEQNTDGLDFD
jgi:hypothetical protein